MGWSHGDDTQLFLGWTRSFRRTDEGWTWAVIGKWESREVVLMKEEITMDEIHSVRLKRLL